MTIGKQLSDKNSDGTVMGQSATDKIGFYGTTPVVQRAGAAQAAAAASNSACNTNVIVEIAATLTALGLWKGGA